MVSKSGLKGTLRFWSRGQLWWLLTITIFDFVVTTLLFAVGIVNATQQLLAYEDRHPWSNNPSSVEFGGAVYALAVVTPVAGWLVILVQTILGFTGRLRPEVVLITSLAMWAGWGAVMAFVVIGGPQGFIVAVTVYPYLAARHVDDSLWLARWALSGVMFLIEIGYLTVSARAIDVNRKRARKAQVTFIEPGDTPEPESAQHTSVRTSSRSVPESQPRLSMLSDDSQLDEKEDLEKKGMKN